MRIPLPLPLTTLLLSLTNVLASTVPLSSRQIDCSVYDKSFPGPVYTGPCEYENCGARGQNCRETGWSGCVIGPAFGCPPKFCACTNY
ncbi:hypothetical protein BKA61DRAFT_615584 [Leptodontidium sp. MPI-SDFR-AT-0119]|nr:hypothetical protein BKA61DRAFT_615584 [Leptodontidium sp. MPI-SDFR-AT-0119]